MCDTVHLYLEVKEWFGDREGKGDLGEMVMDFMFKPKDCQDVFWKLVSLEFWLKGAFCRIAPPYVGSNYSFNRRTRITQVQTLYSVL